MRRRWAHKARYGAAAWAALLGSSVAGMAIVMQAAADPAATIANTLAFSGFAAVAIGLAAAVHAPLLRRPRGVKSSAGQAQSGGQGDGHRRPGWRSALRDDAGDGAG